MCKRRFVLLNFRFRFYHIIAGVLDGYVTSLWCIHCWDIWLCSLRILSTAVRSMTTSFFIFSLSDVSFLVSFSVWVRVSRQLCPISWVTTPFSPSIILPFSISIYFFLRLSLSLSHVFMLLPREEFLAHSNIIVSPSPSKLWLPRHNSKGRWPFPDIFSPNLACVHSIPLLWHPCNYPPWRVRARVGVWVIIMPSNWEWARGQEGFIDGTVKLSV